MGIKVASRYTKSTAKRVLCLITSLRDLLKYLCSLIFNRGKEFSVSFEMERFLGFYIRVT